MSLARKQEHEDFQTPESRRAVIRSDRREFIGLRSELVFDFGSYEVCNYSATGIAILVEPGAARFQSAQTYTAAHSVGGIEVGSYELSLARIDRHSAGDANRVAFVLKSGSVPVQKIQTLTRLCKVLNSFHASQQELDRIPPEFRRLTLEAKMALQTLGAKVEEMRAAKSQGSLEEIRIFEDTLIPVVADEINEFFKTVYQQLEESVAHTPEEDLPICIDFFREQLKGMIYQSPFIRRSVSKPLGYSGDFELMNILYRNEHVGDSLFGKCLHAHCLNHPEARAVRNRPIYLYQVLLRLLRERAGTPVKIGSIACGPCWEVQMLIESAGEQGLDLSQTSFHLLDQDVNALKHAHEKLWEVVKRTGSPVQLNLVNRAIRNMIAHGWQEEGFDLLYSAGLFDYFSDPVARMAATVLFRCVKPGGQLIIGNFNLTTPNKFMMRLALDWSLVYRSPEDLEGLFASLGGELSIEQEPEGVNLFCVIRKP